jgi:hypothetical protein
MRQTYPAVSGRPSVSIDGPLSGFGEVEVISPEPTSQVAFVYTLNPLLVTTQTYGAGASVTLDNGEAVMASGTATDGYARLISKKVAKYRAGQSTMAKWTGRFLDGGFAGNRRMAGLYNIEAGYQFGYDGTTFGILYTEAATCEVQTLTITTKASSATNVTVTLDGGPAVVVPVTNGANTNVTAAEIAAANYSQAAGGWDASAVDNVVYFVRRTAGTAGVSTFAPGTSGAVGAFAILTTGVLPTEHLIPQSAWNTDKFDGTGPSGQTADWTKGNVFGVQFQYLGYGDAFFYVMNGNTGRPQLVHIIRNANTRTSTVLRNPNLYLMWESKNTGTGTSREIRGASGGAFVEGKINFLGAQFGAVGIRTIGAGVETAVLTLRGGQTYNGRRSSAQIQIDRFSVACDGTKTVDFRIYKNATLTAPQFQRVNGTNSASEYDFAATGLSLANATQVYAFSAGKTSSGTESVTDLALFLQAGDTLTIAATSVNASDVSATIVWIEDV